MKALGDHYFAHVGAFEDFPYAVPGLYAGVGARF
jgi:hypothetical protein